MPADVLTEQLDDKARATIHHIRRAVEARRDEDKSIDAKPCGDAIKRANRALDATQNRERREPRGLNCLIRGDFKSYTTEGTDHGSIRGLWTVPGDVDAIAEHAGPRKIDDNVGRDLGRLRQMQAKRGDPLFDREGFRHSQLFALAALVGQPVDFLLHFVKLTLEIVDIAGF